MSNLCDSCNKNEAVHFCHGCDDEPCDCGDDDGEWGVCDDCNSDDGDEYVCNYHRPYGWDMMDAFSKFGNEDGNRYHSYTHFVTDLLEKNGYEVETDSWGMHNSCVIMSIKKDDKEIYGEEIAKTQIVKKIETGYIDNIRKIVEEPFNIGYDNPFLVLPDEIITLLKNAVESQEWIDAGCNGLGNTYWYNDVPKLVEEGEWVNDHLCLQLNYGWCLNEGRNPKTTDEEWKMFNDSFKEDYNEALYNKLTDYLIKRDGKVD